MSAPACMKNDASRVASPSVPLKPFEDPSVRTFGDFRAGRRYERDELEWQASSSLPQTIPTKRTDHSSPTRMAVSSAFLFLEDLSCSLDLFLRRRAEQQDAKRGELIRTLSSRPRSSSMNRQANATNGDDGASSTHSDTYSPPLYTNGSTNSNGFPSTSSFAFDLEANMTTEEKAERRKDEGTKAYKSASYGEALRLYGEAVKLDPANPTYLFNRAAASMALKRFNAAETDCQSVVTMQKAEPSAKTLARLGKCQLALGKIDHAIATLEAALSLEEANTSAKVDLAKCREVVADMGSIERDRGRADWASVSIGIDRISRKVEEVPLQWKIWRLEALLGRKPPRTDEATSLAKCVCLFFSPPFLLNLFDTTHSDMVRSAPQNPDALYWRGMVMYRTGATDQAVNHWKEALRCDPDYAAAKSAWNIAKAVEAKKEEGNTAFKSGRLEDAIAAYTEAMTVDASNEAVTATLLSNRATARLKLKQYDEAMADCEACIAIQPEHVKACVYSARCFLVPVLSIRTGYGRRANAVRRSSSGKRPFDASTRPTSTPRTDRRSSESSRQRSDRQRAT